MSTNVNVTAELLRAAKDYLDMTWADETEERKLFGILARGMKYLNHIAGKKLDYAEGSTETELLLDRARYVLAGSLQDFETDFAGELLGLHIRGEVEAADEEETAEL